MTAEQPITPVDAAPDPAIATPVRGIEPAVSLATAVHAAPGVYALLLGSGVSTAASIPTGWQIVNDLVRRAAAATEPDRAVPDDLDPEVLWTEHETGAELGYSGLLEALSGTAAGRAALLQRYFEATDEDREQGRKVPTAAHEAIADLVARGSVRVIVTTNFDRLLERALEQRGVQPQVIHTAGQVAAMTPLAHARVTVIKLHGDYADLDKRNTVDELAIYPEPLDGLLRRVLDDYGLIVCGWSGDWDIGLVAAVEATRSRRYPLFWASFSTPGESARRLIVQLGGVSLPGVSPDELFAGLRERLAALDRLAAPPLSRELAVASLKRYLPDPVRRIDAHDLIIDEVGRLEALVRDRSRYPVQFPDRSPSAVAALLDKQVRQYRADADTLLHLLAAVAYYGTLEQALLWTTVIRRLVVLGLRPSGIASQALTNLMHYPALLGITTLLAVGDLADHAAELVVPVLLRPRGKSPFRDEEQSAEHFVHTVRVFENDTANALPRWNRGPRDGDFFFAASHLIRQELEDVLSVYEPDATRRETAIDHAEYLTALAQQSAGDQPCGGEFVLRGRYRQLPLTMAAEIRAAVLEGNSVLLADLFNGDRDTAVSALDAVDAAVQRMAERSW